MKKWYFRPYKDFWVKGYKAIKLEINKERGEILSCFSPSFVLLSMLRNMGIWSKSLSFSILTKFP